mmetsp:Transcript_16091/g.22436  ORF Transcript_16091/g.22436 Transcript_16091/m.22436 type:complete len:107 (+) Transcript_16091:163-483(+)
MMGDLLDAVFLHMLNSALSQDSNDSKQENRQETDDVAVRELTSPKNSVETCALDVKSPQHDCCSMSDADLKMKMELSHQLDLGTRFMSLLLEKEAVQRANLGTSMD